MRSGGVLGAMGELIWPTLLLGLGLGLLVAELLLPTGGLLGLLATASLAASLYLAHAASDAIGYRWVVLEALTIAGTWFGVIYGLPRTRLGRRVYLEPPTTEDLDHPGSRLASPILGSSGRVLTPLRPSGMIDLGGRRVEAMAEAGLIEVGEAVTVVGLRSGRAVVRADYR